MRHIFNKLYIIESLSEGRTGRRLYDDLLHLPEKDRLYTVEYQFVNNYAGFMKLMEIIASEIKQEKIIPLLHLEMHGSKDGICFASEENIPWFSIAQLFQQINVLCQNNLIVVLALCYGGHILSVANSFITNRSPFAGIVSSFEDLHAREIEEGFVNYYNELFNSKDGNEAIKTLNQSINDNSREYIYIM